MTHTYFGWITLLDSDVEKLNHVVSKLGPNILKAEFEVVGVPEKIINEIDSNSGFSIDVVRDD